MKLKSSIFFSSLFVLTANAIAIQSNLPKSDEISSNSRKCPNYQLKCPDCPEGTECVYPDSGGCEGAGIPICQATNCHGIVCLIRSSPCPGECPFSCKYNGPACCPFLGEPVCEPTCQTFAPCQVTACPEDCPGDCFYPEADFCCPNAGKAICNKDKWTLSTPAIIDILPTTTASHTSPAISKHHALGYKSGGASEVKGFYDDYRGWSNNYPQEREYYQNYVQSAAYYPYYGYGGNYDRHYGEDYDRHYGENYDRHYGENYDRHEHEYHDDDDYHHEYHQHQHLHHDDSGDCPVCVKTITDISVDVEFVTTTRTSGTIMCAQYIIPCPDECPNNCVYPTHLPCPFTHQPWCPSVVQPPPAEESCEYLYNTEGYPIPYFPTYDPFHSIFTSILNNSGVTSTPSYVTAEPTAAPDVVCPLIFKYCPPECPDTCLRRNVPCPFAEDGYCPGEEASSTITEISRSVSDVGGPALCPLYMLACPYCPDDFTCTRDMTGYCLNTNTPYCISSPTATQTVLPSGTLFEYYPEPEPTPWNDGWGYGYGFNYKLRAMEKENVATREPIDICSELGFTRIENDVVFKQIQERRSDCEDCPALAFDETCDNTCVYFTEDSCCMKVKCLSNSKLSV